MKRVRFTTWLLVLALLAMACPALGEAPEIELGNSAATPAGLEIEPGEDGPAGLDADGISLDLPGLDLSEGLSAEPDGGAEANGGDAGKLSGRYAWAVPPARIAPLTMTGSPMSMPSRRARADPTRMKVSAPQRLNSSMAMAVDGPPMPVEHTLTGTPSYVPV